jgi:hypothetical protein
MTEAQGESEAPRLGALRIRDSVRRSLFALRYYTQLCLPALSRWAAGPPALEIGRVAEVERTLGCRLPDEILACLANGDETLNEFGLTLDQVADHTRRAHQRGCPAELIAVGRHPEGHAIYCITRDGPRERHVRLFLRDDYDGGLSRCDLAGWLVNRVAARREVVVRDRPALVDWAPPPDDVADFVPALVADPDPPGDGG